MPKRLSVEAKLLQWIDEAPLAVVESIMGIASARVKARVRASQPASTPRTTRRKTNSAVAGSATSFPGEGVTGASA